MKTNTVLHAPVTFTPFTVGVMVETDIEYQILHAALNITELQGFRTDDVKLVTDAVYYALEKGIQLSDETAPINDISRRKGIIRVEKIACDSNGMRILLKSVKLENIIVDNEDYIELRCYSMDFEPVQLGVFVPQYLAEINVVTEAVTFTKI